jgi:hypothetical protein
MGTIYKRGQTYWLKYYRNGKPYYESSESSQITKAEKLLKKREGEIAEGKLPGIYFDRVKFDDLAENLLRDYRINQKKSLKRVNRGIEHLKEYFEGFKATQINTPHIQSYIETRQDEGAAILSNNIWNLVFDIIFPPFFWTGDFGTFVPVES